MSDYKRPNQINDTEIESFKEIEISKILENTSCERKKVNYKRIINLSAAFLVSSLLIVLSIFVINSQNNKDYRVVKLNNTEYLLESISEEHHFKLVYKANVVSVGERINYNEIFDYYTPYNYVSKELIDMQEIKFSAFKLNQYRYFLEIDVNDNIKYLEVSFFKTSSITRELFGLEIEDFEADMQEIYELIEEYPPIQNGESGTGIYLINPLIENEEDSIAKNNYIHYVQTYYVHENYNADQEENEERLTSLTVALNQIIVVDESGLELSNHLDYAYVFNINDDLEDLFSDYNEFFDFYESDNDNGVIGTSYTLNKENYETDGFFKLFTSNDKNYLYLLISLETSEVDLNNVSYVSINYSLINNSNNYNVIIDSIYYNNALIVPPVEIIETENVDNYIFSDLIITFYSENDEILKTLNYTYE